VVATDASEEQLENAFSHDRIDYRAERAEETTIKGESVDLITVGTAVHWFDFAPFYEEVRRVSKPGAVLAVWTYFFPVIEPALDRWLQRYYYETLAGFWPERIHYLEEHYQTLPFPFDEIEPPPFRMEAQWGLSDLVGFIASWSATRKYLEEKGSAALDKPMAELEEAWGPKTRKRKIRWPLYVRIGRLPAE
jgi:SAM-dependent methyltransferase